MRKRGRWIPRQYLKTAHLSASALEEKTGRWPRDGDPGRRAPGPVLSVPCSASRFVRASRTGSALPSSRGRVLPAPGRIRGEFAPRNVGHSFGTPNHRVVAAGIPAPGFVSKLSPAHAVSEVPPHPHPNPHILATADDRFTCTRLVRGSCCFLRVRTQAPPGETPRRCCCRRCGRRACSELQRSDAPTAAGGAIPGARARRAPAVATTPRLPARGRDAPALGVRSWIGSPSCAVLRIHGASRMGGDSLPLVDSRGGNSLPGVTGTGGGDSPAGMTRWAGIPPPEHGTPRAERPLG